MSEHLLFLTGSLAAPSLHRVLHDLQAPTFSWEVRELGLKVAALMTADMILRRLPDIGRADRVILPGRCRGDLARLSDHFGVPFERGPEELRDLPEWLGQAGRPIDLSRHDVTLFAEIVDAPRLSLDGILARALAHRADGAEVIDLGCLPEQPFPHLAEAVAMLKEAGLQVSVDSLLDEELIRAGQAGADYLLSLTEQTLWIADEVPSTPVLIPAQAGDLDSLQRAWETLHAAGRAALVDPIMEPIHFGFVESIVRYRELRQRLPDAALMMGIGNVTELTEADTCGINAVLFGIVSELRVAAVLTTQVSPHCRSAIREADLARRIMYRAREDGTLPKLLHGGLTGLHERKPFPYDRREIERAAEAVKDRNFRIQVADDGIHIYNRELHRIADEPFSLFPHLEVAQDGGHAFYLGVELARAEIALRLGKRYTQDQPLRWGAALAEQADDRLEYAEPASTKGTKSAAGS
ncbi:MAG: dihydropteroate synthase [Chromatiaceae bacterium]|nr:dihydropteroate synthase [Chromatiaceae bacterium]MCP5314250.1 dihydropteroate synthase [Chromatiaceae bacterium]